MSNFAAVKIPVLDTNGRERLLMRTIGLAQNVTLREDGKLHVEKMTLDRHEVVSSFQFAAIWPFEQPVKPPTPILHSANITLSSDTKVLIMDDVLFDCEPFGNLTEGIAHKVGLKPHMDESLNFLVIVEQRKPDAKVLPEISV